MKSQLITSTFKKVNNNPNPKGKGNKIINHIGALNFSAKAPAVTTTAPITSGSHQISLLNRVISAKKYVMAVNMIAAK